MWLPKIWDGGIDGVVTMHKQLLQHQIDDPIIAVEKQTLKELTMIKQV